MQYALIALAVIILIFLLSNIVTVQQGHVLVLTRFGKYKKILAPGLHVKSPLDSKFLRLSLQNRAMEVNFQAITKDQAYVYFKAMLQYSVANGADTTVQNAAFFFNSQQEFILALQKQIEGEVRAFVANKNQDEILGVRQEMASAIKGNIDQKIEQWGYALHDIQITDLSFGPEITQSMEKVVASSNLRKAAENEGVALLIKKTKEAEAEGAYIRIQAESEKEAWRKKGEGLSAFREEIAKGLASSVEGLKNANVNPDYLLFFTYNDTLKHIAEKGVGSTLFVDSSAGAQEKIMASLAAMSKQPDISNAVADVSNK
ncbi:MAG: SPFH domain-containing protein [Bacillota bacterium]|nr:SPFH domain-containing protein [Bacillota bacterium]